MRVFFMSFARIPVPRHPDASQDPHRLVLQFFDELCGNVARQARVPREEAGFVERPGMPDEESIKALFESQVFVPLYSKRYFSSPRCGREWTVATHKVAQGSRPSIVPVLWTPHSPTSLPTRIKEQYPEVPEGIGEAAANYASMGMHRLLRLTERPDPENEHAAAQVSAQVAQVTDWLAKRIVDQAATVPRWPQPQSRPADTARHGVHADPPEVVALGP